MRDQVPPGECLDPVDAVAQGVDVDEQVAGRVPPAAGVLQEHLQGAEQVTRMLGVIAFQRVQEMVVTKASRTSGIAVATSSRWEPRSAWVAQVAPSTISASRRAFRASFRALRNPEPPADRAETPRETRGPASSSSASATDRSTARHPGAPVRRRGFHHGNVTEGRHLTRDDLDRVATDREVLVFHSSGHGAAVNTWTLHLRGIGRDTPDPVGGHFGRAADGTPNGLVWDAAADVLTGDGGVKVGNNGPNFHLAEEQDELVAHLAAAQADFLAAGVTTIVDAQVTSRELLTYLRLRDVGGLRMRVEMLALSSMLDQIEALGLGGRLGDPGLDFAGVKLYSDGALSSGTARWSKPYCCDPGDHGYLYHDPAELTALIQRAHRAGLQAGIHAQGDAAIGAVLDALEQAQAAYPRVDARHRIEHCGGPSRIQVERIARAGAWPVTQPQYVLRYGDELRRALGERAERLVPLAEFQAHGIPIVLSSDAPVCPPRPLEAVYAAAARRTLSDRRLGDNAITVSAALRGHTLGAAASIHRDHDLGSLEAGKLADLVVLSDDPTAVAIEELPGLRVLSTWIGGRPVHTDRPYETVPAS
jgi:predicted amidohydrolase YtcJ